MAQRRRGPKPIMARELCVSSVVFSVSTRAEKARGGDPKRESNAWLHVEGRLEEPIRDVSSMAITVHPESEWHRGTLGPPSVGGIISFTPQIQCVVGIPDDAFDRVWLLATASQLKFCHVAFTERERRHAFVVSVSFSNKSEYEEDDRTPETNTS
jgi:hypothetical protein